MAQSISLLSNLRPISPAMLLCIRISATPITKAIFRLARARNAIASRTKPVPNNAGHQGFSRSHIASAGFPA